ncbi:hypothetical protein [Massilia sp. CF038]|uniref:hypothetical protein n=1 Tax=Massilia sp. CF038 TaxID=1881045 RepID=UPI000918938E|nr:hypothetical protein [Massilia sp. CF038]SHH70038.1 hypothetical protein SAMN05428948_5005 [Massilia sp. CF038]
MSITPTLADRLAQNRANGQVSVSKQALFSRRALPTWAQLGLTPYLCVFGACFSLYLISLVLVWDQFMAVRPFFSGDLRHLGLAIALNYLVLMWSACIIQYKLQSAGLQRSGWGVTVICFILLNPLILGWAVAIVVLWRAVAAYHLLQAEATEKAQ